MSNSADFSTATSLSAAAPTGVTGTQTTTFTVSGMTCEHCVRAVTDEITESVPGVEAVRIELTDGRVTVTSRQPLSGDDLAAAVEEAGYQLVAGSLR